MSQKNIAYDIAQKYVKDKDTAVNTFIEHSLNKTQQMFIYENLPDSIPQSELENLLQVHGHCIIAEVDGVLYAFNGGFSGENDVYNNPRFYQVTNTALKLSKQFEIGVDCVLVKNDFHAVGILPILQKYATVITDSEISLNTATILSRITMLISAPDDKTKASADLFVQKILNGDFTVIGENGFFDGVKLQTASTANSNYITQLVELVQYYKASFLNEIGLQANFNMKRERLIENEVMMNIDNLLPYVENMFTERCNAVEKINEMFKTEIVVDYNGVWKTTHEHAEREEEVVTDEDIIETEETTVETEETIETEETAETIETEVETTENEIETEETEETVIEEEVTEEPEEVTEETEVDTVEDESENNDEERGEEDEDSK